MKKIIMKEKEDQDTLVEIYNIDPYQGAAALMVGCSREGYRIIKIDRKGKKAKVTYERIK